MEAQQGKESNYIYEMLEKDFFVCKQQFLNESGLIPEGKELLVYLVDDHESFTPSISREFGDGQQRISFEKDYLRAIYEFVSTDVAKFSDAEYKSSVQICRLVANSILYNSFLHEFTHFIRNHHEALDSINLSDKDATKLVELDADTIAACMLWDFLQTTNLSRKMKVMALVMGIRGQFEIVHRYFKEKELVSAYGLPPVSRAYIAITNVATSPYFNDNLLEVEAALELLYLEDKLFADSVAADIKIEEIMSDLHFWHDKQNLIASFAHATFKEPTFFSKSTAKKRKVMGALQEAINTML